MRSLFDRAYRAITIDMLTGNPNERGAQHIFLCHDGHTGQCHPVCTKRSVSNDHNEALVHASECIAAQVITAFDRCSFGQSKVLS